MSVAWPTDHELACERRAAGAKEHAEQGLWPPAGLCTAALIAPGLVSTNVLGLQTPCNKVPQASDVGAFPGATLHRVRT